jgi:hypothetical protein
LFIPDQDPKFVTIPDPGVKKAPDPASHLRLSLFARRRTAGSGGLPPALILLTPVRLGLRVVLLWGTPATKTHNNVMNSVADPETF